MVNFDICIYAKDGSCSLKFSSLKFDLYKCMGIITIKRKGPEDQSAIVLYEDDYYVKE